MKIIDGGVCAAKGFKAGSVRCGIKASRTNDDTAIIFSECECNAAATYTMNRVKAAPVYVTMWKTAWLVRSLQTPATQMPVLLTAWRTRAAWRRLRQTSSAWTRRMLR